VRVELITLGVDPARLESVGYGESRPIAPNATRAGRALNRRTEFNIVEPTPPAAPAPTEGQPAQ
jgi:outer membrane protein OmpA-like peptidoglycan-associated protein